MVLHIAQNLRLIRETVLEISRNEFANYLSIPGVTHHILQNFEGGRTVPKESVILAIAQKVGVDPNDLKNKKLTKKDIPVIVIEKNEQDSSVIEALKTTIETQQVQINQQQQVITVLLEKLKEA
jgi:hypothetical protein